VETNYTAFPHAWISIGAEAARCHSPPWEGESGEALQLDDSSILVPVHGRRSEGHCRRAPRALTSVLSPPRARFPPVAAALCQRTVAHGLDVLQC